VSANAGGDKLRSHAGEAAQKGTNNPGPQNIKKKGERPVKAERQVVKSGGRNKWVHGTLIALVQKGRL